MQTVICFGFLFSVFFLKAKVAAAVTGVVYLIMILPYLVLGLMQKPTPTWVLLSSPVAFGDFLKAVQSHSDIWPPFLFLWLDIIIYACLVMYFDAVVPQTDDADGQVVLPFYFPCMPSWWASKFGSRRQHPAAVGSGTLPSSSTASALSAAQGPASGVVQQHPFVSTTNAEDASLLAANHSSTAVIGASESEPHADIEEVVNGMEAIRVQNLRKVCNFLVLFPAAPVVASTDNIRAVSCVQVFHPPDSLCSSKNKLCGSSDQEDVVAVNNLNFSIFEVSLCLHCPFSVPCFYLSHIYLLRCVVLCFSPKLL